MEKLDLAGALSWYSRAYLYGIFGAPTWKSEQEGWIDRGYGWGGFDLNNSLVELKSWRYWTQSQDFSDIIYYIIICTILERRKRLNTSEHTYFIEMHALLKEKLNTNETKVALESLINQTKSMSVPQTTSALTYAYESYLSEKGLLTSSRYESKVPTPSKTDAELEAIRAEIELKRLERQTKGIKQQGRQKLTTQQKIIYGVSTSVLVLGIIAITTKNRRGK